MYDELTPSDIKKMEEELGYPLFIRSSNKIALTKAGQGFLPYAIQIVESYDEYTNQMIKSQQESKHIVIGISDDAMLDSRIASCFTAAAKYYKEYNFSIINQTSDQLKELAQLHKCDLIILYEVDNPEEEDDNVLNKIMLYQDQVAILLHQDHPLANNECISFDQLANEPLVSFDSNSIFRSIITNQLATKQLAANFVYEVSRKRPLFELVSQKIGITCFSRRLLSSFLNSNSFPLRVVDLKEPIHISCNIRYAKKSRLSPDIESLISNIQRNIN